MLSTLLVLAAAPHDGTAPYERLAVICDGIAAEVGPSSVPVSTDAKPEPGEASTATERGKEK